MSLISAFAIYFIIWWLVLFTTLPIGVRSQAEEGEAILGTEHGAPVASRLPFKLILTTVISAVLFAIFYYVTVVMGLGVDDIPWVAPNSSSQ